MLTQEQLVDIHVLHRQGLSNREIARPTKLGPYEAYLRERIKDAEPDWIPATVLFREISGLTR